MKRSVLLIAFYSWYLQPIYLLKAWVHPETSLAP